MTKTPDIPAPEIDIEVEPSRVHPDLTPRPTEDPRLKAPGRPIVRTAGLVGPKPARLGKDEGGDEILEQGRGLVEVPIEFSHNLRRVDARGRPVDRSEPLRFYLDKKFELLTGFPVSELNEASRRGLERNGSWTEDLAAGVLSGEKCAVNQCWNKASSYDRGSPLCPEHDLLVGAGLVRMSGTRGGEAR